jgi:hypothetical protein
VYELAAYGFAENFHLVIHVHLLELGLEDALLQQVVPHL